MLCVPLSVSEQHGSHTQHFYGWSPFRRSAQSFRAVQGAKCSNRLSADDFNPGRSLFRSFAVTPASLPFRDSARTRTIAGDSHWFESFGSTSIAALSRAFSTSTTHRRPPPEAPVILVNSLPCCLLAAADLSSRCFIRPLWSLRPASGALFCSFQSSVRPAPSPSSVPATYCTAGEVTSGKMETMPSPFSSYSGPLQHGLDVIPGPASPFVEGRSEKRD